ncbi:MAG TPA: hypothetical protein VM597_07160, partial [Gemmataceae bacterium]|nr:hypothetical protein [Gemmataceae bacterium]
LLRGGASDDILIAGVTRFDSPAAAGDLLPVVREWVSSRSYADRVKNLEGTGTGPRENGDTFLTGPAIQDDAAPDRLNGGAGQDWFLIDPNGLDEPVGPEERSVPGRPSIQDRVVRRRRGEIATVVNG